MKLLNRIDLHLVYLLVMFIPLGLLVLPLLWVALVTVLTPQPMIITRYYDELRMDLPAREYLYVNEVLVVMIGFVMAVIACAK